MRKENSGYEQILIGDLYHWELDSNGYFIVEENASKTTYDDTCETGFETFDLDNISEDIIDA